MIAVAAFFFLRSYRTSQLRDQKLAALISTGRDLREFQKNPSESYVKLKEALLLDSDSWEALYEMGVTCLALCKEHIWLLKKLDAKLRGRIDKGLLAGIAWLSDNFSVEENPTPGGASMWHYYYLYGLERTGSKVGTRWIGKHDWYREGGEHLLAAQEKNGGWKEPDGTQRPVDATESAITQTCFALLFLKRSTRKPFVPMMPTVTGGGGAPKDGR